MYPITSSAPKLVKELIDKSSRQWKLDQVDNLLDNNTREKILAIPITSSLEKDKTIWHFEKSGSYSVRSGYLRQRL